MAILLRVIYVVIVLLLDNSFIWYYFLDCSWNTIKFERTLCIMQLRIQNTYIIMQLEYQLNSSFVYIHIKDNYVAMKSHNC